MPLQSRVVLGLLLGLCAATSAQAQIAETRLTPDEIAKVKRNDAAPGASGVAGIQTTVISGDPAGPGLYTIRLSVPADTRIQAHRHRDDRSATVLSGTWFFGYGPTADEQAVRALPPGSFYTEPGGAPHFALTRSDPVVLLITGYGPTDTTYVDAAQDPRR